MKRSLALFICLAFIACEVPPLPVVPVHTTTPDVNSGCCAKAWPGTTQVGTHQAKGTGYYPFNNAMEGGVNDKVGKPLQTLQGFLSGKYKVAGVAMDKSFKYGTKICVPEMEKKYGKPISFEIRDTGGAFYGKGWDRIDFCVDSRQATFEDTANGAVTIVECR